MRYFVAVAEELSFSRAAERVHLSQPALSQQIRKLEDELGTVLFLRTRRRVELTEAGEALLEGVRQPLLQVEQAVRTVREVGGVARKRFKVGFPVYANHTIVAEILQAFQERYPDVELEQHEVLTLQQTPQQIEELRAGTLDVGFLLLPVEVGDLSMERVLRMELLAALPEDHPLAARREVMMRELAGERMILFPRRFHPGCYDYVVGCCREAGFVPNVVRGAEARLYSGPTTYRMVASGTGTAIVAPPLTSPFRPDGVVFRPLREPTPVLELAAAWRSEDASRKLWDFLEVLREYRPVEVAAGDSPALLPNKPSGSKAPPGDCR